MDLRTCKKILLFGGSFDPPHLAHVQLPKLAMQATHADAVGYLPAGRQPFKTHLQQTPAHHRLAMLRLALQDEPWAEVLTDEIDRAAATGDDSPSYLVDTLEALRARLGQQVQFRLLIGGDSLRQFHRWRSPGRILALAPPVDMVRPPDTRQSLLENLPPGFDPQPWIARMIDLPLIDLSSTRVRQLVAQGRSIHGMVSPSVEAYVKQHRLYTRP